MGQNKPGPERQISCILPCVTELKYESKTANAYVPTYCSKQTLLCDLFKPIVMNGIVWDQHAPYQISVLSVMYILCWVPIHVLAVPFLIRLPNLPGMTAGDGPNSWPQPLAWKT